MPNTHKEVVEKALLYDLKKSGFFFANLKELRKAEKTEGLKTALIEFSRKSILFDCNFIAKLVGENKDFFYRNKKTYPFKTNQIVLIFYQ